MHGHEHNGKILYVQPAQRKAHRQMELNEKLAKLKMEAERRMSYEGANLYVDNLDDNIDDERLRKEFAPFGNITSAKVMREEKSTNSKGFGFVCFSSPEEATKAVTEMNGRIIVSKPLYVALARRKGQRPAQLASQYLQRLASLRVQHSPQIGQRLDSSDESTGDDESFPVDDESLPVDDESSPVKKDLIEQVSPKQKKFTNVYIKDVTDDIDDEQLEEMLSEFSKVASASSLRKSHICNIFIKNLDESIGSEALYDTFSAFGNVLSCEVAYDENNQPIGFGFVHFETEQAAKVAIEKVNGMLLNGKQVSMARFITHREGLQQVSDKQKKFTIVYIKHITDEIDDKKLEEMFSEFGKVTCARVTNDHEGKSRSFGFVAFEEPEAAELAVQKMHGHEHNGKILSVQLAEKKAQRQLELKEKFEKLKMERIKIYEGVYLYVKNLDDNIDDERLRKEFAPFGNITSAKVMREKKSTNSKGFGFVCFSSPEEATKAVTEMNGRIIVSKPLYVALALRKDQRRAQLASPDLQRLASLCVQNSPQIGQTIQPGVSAQAQDTTMAQAQSGYFTPQMAPIRAAQPRWPSQSQVRQPQPSATGFQAMPSGVQQPRPTGQQPVRSAVNARPITGQQSTGGPTAPRVQMPPQACPPAPPMSAAGARPPCKYTNAARNAQVQPTAPREQMPPQARLPVPTKSAAKRRKYRYTNAARKTKPVGQTAVHMVGQEPLTASKLAAALPQQQKQMLGERLFPLIQCKHEDLAGKITGMLLELDNSKLLHMLQYPKSLAASVEEAVTVLKAHQAKTDCHQAKVKRK